MFVGKKALKYSKNQPQKTSQKNFKYHTKKTFQNNRKTIDKTAKQLDFFLPQKLKASKTVVAKRLKALFHMKTRVFLKYFVNDCTSVSLAVKGNCVKT